MNSSNLEEIKCTAFAKALDVIKLDSILQYKDNPLNIKLEEMERNGDSMVQVSNADFKSKLSNFVQQELFEAKERDKKKSITLLALELLKTKQTIMELTLLTLSKIAIISRTMLNKS